MPARSCYDYAVIRVVPRVEREEFVNVGVILSCPSHDFLEASVQLDRMRLAALHRSLDLDVIERHLLTIPVVCSGGVAAGAIGRLNARQRFYWLTAPRSTQIQTSAVHTGLCDGHPRITLDHLMATMVLA